MTAAAAEIARADVNNAPAGSGKTRVLTDTGRAWAATGLGPVVGITASQPARNTLADYGQHGRILGGEPGRALANGDLLRIEAVTAGGLVVRRALDADPRTGQRRWTHLPEAGRSGARPAAGARACPLRPDPCRTRWRSRPGPPSRLAG